MYCSLTENIGLANDQTTQVVSHAARIFTTLKSEVQFSNLDVAFGGISPYSDKKKIRSEASVAIITLIRRTYKKTVVALSEHL